MLVIFTLIERVPLPSSPCTFLSPAFLRRPLPLTAPRVTGIQPILWSVSQGAARRVSAEEEVMRRSSSCDILLSVVMNEVDTGAGRRRLTSGSFDALPAPAPAVVGGGASSGPSAVPYDPAAMDLGGGAGGSGPAAGGALRGGSFDGFGRAPSSWSFSDADAGAGGFAPRLSLGDDRGRRASHLSHGLGGPSSGHASFGLDGEFALWLGEDVGAAGAPAGATAGASPGKPPR